MADQDYVNVVAGPTVAAGKVVLWERNPSHPDGEVFIAAPEDGQDAKPVKAARTSDVEGHLRSGALVEVGSRRAPLGKDD